MNRWLPLLLLLLAGLVGADRMVLVPAGKVVGEPGQKAVVAYDGKTELLLLATDLVAKEPTRVLQALPLPGKPVITLANPKLLDEMKELLEHLHLGLSGMNMRSGHGSGTIQIVSHQKLGPHDLVVLKLDGTGGLNGLLQKHLGQRLSAAAVALVEDYRKRGCRYLAVDLVEVGTEPGSVPPVAYRFASPALFYPLMTSNLVGGEGAVDLFVIGPPLARHSFEKGTQLPFTRNDLDPLMDTPLSPARGEELPRAGRYGSSEFVTLTAAQLGRLDAGLATLLPQGGLLVVHHYEGPLKFGRDLSLSPGWLGLVPLLPIAARDDVKSLEQILRERPQDINQADYMGQTALHGASERGALSTARVLLAAGAQVDVLNNYRETPLHLSAGAGHVALVAALIKAGARPNARDDRETTPLHRALRNRRTVELLVQAGADVNALDEYGVTVLMSAASQSDPEILQLMLTPAARLQAVDHQGNTALHLAAAAGRATNVRLLLAAGASKSVRNNDHQTPAEAATGEARAVFSP